MLSGLSLSAACDMARRYHGGRSLGCCLNIGISLPNAEAKLDGIIGLFSDRRMAVKVRVGALRSFVDQWSAALQVCLGSWIVDREYISWEDRLRRLQERCSANYVKTRNGSRRISWASFLKRWNESSPYGWTAK
jgi:hypothetical protein